MHLRRLLAAVIATGIAAHASTASAQSRVDVHVLQYTGQGAEGQEQLAQVVHDNLLLLASQISGQARGATYVRSLKVISRPRERPGDLNSLRARWRQPNVLMMMWGNVAMLGSRSVASSSIYLGDLAAPDRQLITTAQIDLSARNHGQIKDTHSLAAAYALLLDAERTRQPRNVIAAILSRLHVIRTQVRSGPLHNADLDELDRSIARIARANGLPA